MLKRIILFSLTTMLLFVSASFAVETKDIRFPLKHADPVVFSHDVHLAKYNNKCKVCHDAIFNLRNRRHFTMAEMEKTKGCGACHSGIKAFSVASEKDCIKCHKGKPREVTYQVKGLGTATFSHSIHIAKTGGACRNCHNGKVITGKQKAVTMAEMEKGRTCGACHNGKKAFSATGSCNRCHKGMNPKEITFNLKGVTPATFSHKFHTQAYACKDCHTRVFPFKAVTGKFTMADMEKGAACGACHAKGKDAFPATGDCDKCHKGMKPGVITFKTDAGVATFSHEFHLQAYKCADCHTKVFPYKAQAGKFTMADMEKGAACGACHNKDKDAFSVKDDKFCDKCHKM